MTLPVIDMNYNRKHFYNFNYFETIDTEEKAYWVGFLYADGSIKQNKLRLTLSEKDSDHVYKFAKSLDFKYPNIFHKEVSAKKNGKKHKTCGLVISCKKLTNDLKNVGMTERKTYDICLPKINDDLIYHFIRGFFDGDGSVILIGKNQTRCSVCIVGLKNILEFIANKIQIQGKIYKTSSRIVNELKFSANKDTHHFYDLIYKNATIYLSRKKEKFETFFINELPPIKKASKYLGVGFDKKTKRWYASFYRNNKRIRLLGNFETEFEAHTKRLQEIIKYDNYFGKASGRT